MIVKICVLKRLDNIPITLISLILITSKVQELFGPDSPELAYQLPLSITAEYLSSQQPSSTDSKPGAKLASLKEPVGALAMASVVSILNYSHKPYIA